MNIFKAVNYFLLASMLFTTGCDALEDKELELLSVAKIVLNNTDYITLRKALSNNDKSIGELNVIVDRKMPILLKAVSLGSIELVKILLENGIDINTQFQEAYGIFPAQLAAMSTDCNIQMLRFLLDNGADVNNVNGQDQTSLLQSTARRGSYECFKLVLSYKPELNHKNIFGFDALFSALSNYDENKIIDLVNMGINITCVYQNGVSLIKLAAGSGNAKIISIIGKACTEFGGHQH